MCLEYQTTVKNIFLSLMSELVNTGFGLDGSFFRRELFQAVVFLISGNLSWDIIAENRYDIEEVVFLLLLVWGGGGSVCWFCFNV